MTDLTDFWNAADNDPQLAYQLATMYVEVAKQTVEQIQHAIDQNDLEAVCELLHRLKGSTSILGFDQEQQEIEQLYKRVKRSELSGLTELPSQLHSMLTPISDTLRRQIIQ